MINNALGKAAINATTLAECFPGEALYHDVRRQIGRHARSGRVSSELQNGRGATLGRSALLLRHDEKKKGDAKNAPKRLFLVHAVIYLARSPKHRLVDHALIAYYEAARPKPPIPDCALDKHTSAGRARKRGHAHFWTEGTTVENKAILSEPYDEIAKATRVDKQGNLEL